MELEDKFFVIKNEDIVAALDNEEKRTLWLLTEKIRRYRARQGKQEHTYVVINQDEPYFPDVLKLME